MRLNRGIIASFLTLSLATAASHAMADMSLTLSCDGTTCTATSNVADLTYATWSGKNVAVQWASSNQTTSTATILGCRAPKQVMGGYGDNPVTVTVHNKLPTSDPTVFEEKIMSATMNGCLPGPK